MISWKLSWKTYLGGPIGAIVSTVALAYSIFLPLIIAGKIASNI